MSELSDFRRKLLSHQVMQENVPQAYLLGIPRLQLYQGQLVAFFCPHKVSIAGDRWLWSTPAFQMICVYPSCKVLYFANLRCPISPAPQPEPASFSTPIEQSEPLLRQLEELCSEALRQWEEQKDDIGFIRFERMRKDIAAQLGLQALWGE